MFHSFEILCFDMFAYNLLRLIIVLINQTDDLKEQLTKQIESIPTNERRRINMLKQTKLDDYEITNDLIPDSLQSQY